MPMIAFFLPIIIAYIFFIPSILRHGTACLRSWKPHTAAVSCAVFTLAILVLCFIDFGAFLLYTLTSAVYFLECVAIAKYPESEIEAVIIAFSVFTLSLSPDRLKKVCRGVSYLSSLSSFDLISF